MIYMTSDWHFCHNKDFVYAARGYANHTAMNQEIIKLYNSIVTYEDEVYFLGDGYLSCTDNEGCSLINQLNGTIHWIIGNHDTDNKLAAIAKCHNVADINYGARLKYKGMNFYLSHYPTLTANFGKSKPVFNLCGHTHTIDRFELWHQGCYNVGVDAHHCDIVSLDTIIKDIQNRM